MDELEKTSVDCNSGLYKYRDMTKPGTNRHLEIHEKTLGEQNFLCASRTCLINLPLSFILKLLEVNTF